MCIRDRNYGFENLKSFGDSRINKALENLSTNRARLKWKSNSTTIIFGSLLPAEINMMVKVIERYTDFNFLIAPHDIDKKHLEEVTSKLSSPVSFITEIKDNKIPNKILIINSLGDLKYLYPQANLAYVGGGFDKGPHSIIEPLVYGTPTIIGPNIQHYPMARELKKDGVLTVINNEEELPDAMNMLLSTTPESVSYTHLTLPTKA